MSCRKFEAPRHGSLAFCPRKRASKVRPSLRAFPADDATKPCHLTAFFGYKVGMTHVVRISERRKANEKKATSAPYEVLDPVTIVETPPVLIYGMVGYKKTINGLKRSVVLVHPAVSDNIILRHNRAYKHNKANPLEKYYFNPEAPELNEIKACDQIRAMVAAQTETIPTLKTKKAHVMEVAINGGSISEKVDWAIEHMKESVPVSQVFTEQENIDVVAVTKGKGFQGTVKRFGVTILPRKSNKGKRKVACIGAWHPSRVMWTVPRAGQMGYHRRTEINKRIYSIGNGQVPTKTPYDLTLKTVNPMGGFKHYGFVKQDYLMLKGSIAGPRKRVMVLRKSLDKEFSTKNSENIVLKFVDTSSKIGAGRFQTVEEKNAYYGIKKRKITEICEQEN